MLSNKVEEIMTREVISAGVSDKISDVIATMALKNVGCVMIADNQVPVGIFTEQDLLKRVMNKSVELKKTDIQDVMTAPIHAVGQETHIVEALGKMVKGNFRHLLVLGNKWMTVGMISMRDILKLAVKLGKSLVETQTIGSIMSTDPTTVDASQTIMKTIEIMNKEDTGCVVVLSNGQPKGIFTERDVLKRVAIKDVDTRKTAIREVMTVGFVSENHSALIGEVLAEMNKWGFRNMPIRSDGGHLVGIVSMRNVLLYAKAFDVDGIVRKAWKEIEDFWDSAEHFTPG